MGPRKGRPSLQIEELGGTIGSYRLVRKIGRGNMGTVYEAVDEAGRRVAIKVLTGELVVHEELVERFRREAVSAAHLDHPNITKVVDFGGQRAFGGKRLTDVMTAVIDREPVPLAECAPGTLPPVAFVVGRCLRKKPAERYATAGELYAALQVLAFSSSDSGPA